MNFFDQFTEDNEGEEDQRCTSNCFDVETKTNSDTESADYPEGGSGGEAGDRSLRVGWTKDDARTNETDTGDNLGGDTGWVYVVIVEDFCSLYGGYSNQCGTETNDDVCTNTGRLSTKFSFEANETSEEGDNKKPDDDFVVVWHR